MNMLNIGGGRYTLESVHHCITKHTCPIDCTHQQKHTMAYLLLILLPLFIIPSFAVLLLFLPLLLFIFVVSFFSLLTLPAASTILRRDLKKEVNISWV